MILDFLGRIRGPDQTGVRNAVTPASPGVAETILTRAGTETAALKLAVVNRCLEVISDSMGKMPSYCIDGSRSRQGPPVLALLNDRPNEGMTPFLRRKVLELNRLVHGNGYEWILRDPVSMAPAELIPLPARLVVPWRDTAGRIWYDVSHPYTGEIMRLPMEDVCHYRAYTKDGVRGISVLERAAEIIGAGTAAQEYQNAYYSNGGQPSGVLETETDLGGYIKDPETNLPTELTYKDALRREWERVHSGPSGSHRVAILDHGLKYHPITATMAEAQFVETHDLTVIDICNFFGVPAYKVNAGKQSYSSNEQNAIEYVVGTLQPIVTQMEQEQTWRLLTPGQRRAGLELRLNMMVELRGDYASRAAWYEKMSNLGAYSVNDVRELEDLPDVEGGEERKASLNYVPLSQWPELSVQRAGAGGGGTTEGGDSHESSAERRCGR